MAGNICKALTISKIKRYRENVVKTFSPKLVLTAFISSMRDESFPTEDAALSVVASFILEGDEYEGFLSKSILDKKAFFAGTDALTREIVGSAPGFNTYQDILDTLQGIEAKSANIVITTEKGAGLKQSKTTTTDDGTTIELAEALDEDVVIQKPLTGFLALKSKRVQGTFLLSPDSVDYWVPFFESYFPAQIGLAMEFKELVTDRINDALVDITSTGKGFTEDVDASLTKLKNLVKRNLKNRAATAYSSPDFLKTLATNTDLKAKYFDDIFLLEFDFIVANLTKNVAVSEKKTREANQVVEGFYNEANFPFKGLVLNIKDIKKEFTPGEAKDQFIVGEGINPIIVSLDVDSHSLINSANLRRRSIYHSSVDNKYFYFPRRVGADPIDVSPELKYDFSSMSSANKNSIDHHVSGFDNHTAFINNIFSMFRRIETDADGEIVFKERMSKRDFDILAPKLVNAGTDAKDFLDSLRTLAKERDTEQGILANSILVQIFSPQNSAKYGIKSIQSIINKEGPWTKSVNINVLNSLRVALTAKENLQYLKVEEGSTTVTKKITDTSFSNDANNIVASLLLDNTKTKPAIAELIKVAADQRSFQVHHNGRVYQSGEIKDIASVLDVADAMGILNSFEKIYNTIMGTSKDTTSKEESVRHLFKTLLTIAATNKETAPLKTEKISNEFASDLYSATPFDSVASIDHIKVVAKAFNADAARSLAIANKMTSVISAPSREAAMPRQIAKYDSFNAVALDKVGFSPFLNGTDPSIVKAVVSDTVLKSSIVKEGVEFDFSSWDLKIREEHAMIHGFINGSTELGNNFLIQDVNYSNKTTPLFKRVSLEGLNALTNNKETRELLIDNYINYVARKNEDMQRIMIRDVAEYVLGNFSRLTNAKITQGKDDEVSAMYELKELLKKPLIGVTGDMTKPINLLLQRARLSASEVLQSSANIDKDADYIELNNLKDIFILKPNAGVRAAFYRDPVVARDIVNKTLLTNRARLQELGLNRDSSDMTTVAAALKMAVEKATKGNSAAMVTDAQEFYDRYFLVNGVYGHALKVMSLGDETYYGGRYNYDTIEQYYDSVDVGEVDGLEEHNKMLITQFKRAQTLLTRGSAYSTKVTMEGFKRGQRRDNTLYYAEAVGDFDVKTGAVETYVFPKLTGKTITELAGLGVIEPFSDGALIHIESVGGNEIYSAKFIIGKNEVTIRIDESRSKLTDYSYENALKTLLVNSVEATKTSLADQDMMTDISVSQVEIVARPLKSKEGNITLSRFKEVLKEQVTDFQVVLPDVAHSITMEEPVSYVDVLNAMGVKQDNSDGVQFIHPLMHMYLGRARGGDLAAFNTEDFTALKFLTTTFEYNKFRQVIGKKSIQYPFSFEQFKKFGSVSMYNAFKKMNTAVSFPQPKMRTSMEPGAPMIIANNMQELFEQIAISLPTGYTDERKIWGKIMDILSINQRNMYSFVGYVTLPSGQKTGLKKVNPIDKIFSGTKEAASSEVVLDQIDHEYHYEVLTKDHEYDVTPNSGKRSTIKLLSQLVTAISFGGLSTDDNMKLHAAIEGTVGVNTATLNWKYIKIATALRDKAPAIKKPLYNVVIERFNKNQLGFDDVTEEIADVIEDVFKASVIDMAERTLSKDKPAALGKIVRTVSDVMGVSLEDKLSLDGPMTKNDVVNALRSALYSDDVQIHLPGFIAAATTNNKVVSMFTSANGTRLSRQAFIEEAFKTGVEGTGAEIVEITAENFSEYKELVLPFDLISIDTPRETIFREMGIITPAVFSKYPVIKAVITPDVAVIGKSIISKDAFLKQFLNTLVKIIEEVSATEATNTEVFGLQAEKKSIYYAKKQAAQTLLSKIDDNSKLLIKDETGEVVAGLYKWYLMKTKSLDEVVDLLENGRLVEDTSETFGLKWYRYYKLNDDGTKTYIESDPSYRAYYEATVGKKSPDEVLNARTLLTLEMQKKDLMGRPLWNVILPETILPSFSRTAFDIPKGTSLYNIIGTDGNDLLNAAKFFRRDARIQRRFKPFKLGPVADVRRYYASKAATEIFDGINSAILNVIKDIETPEFSIETINEVNKLINDSKHQEINNTARSFVDSLKVILAHIPGQSKQSGIPSQVVEFLDSQGNMAMSPTESMVTTGGDYDIDTFSVATFALDSVGKIIASSEDLYEDQEYNKKQIVGIYKERLRKINQVIRTKVDYLNAEIDAYISTLDPIADVEKIASAEKSKKGEEDIALMVKKAEKSLHGLFKDILTNRVLQSMIDSLSNPATQVEVNTAMSMDIFKPQLEKVKKVAQKPAKAEVSMGMKSITYSDEILEPMPAFYKTEAGSNIVNLGPTNSEVESFLPPFTIFNDIPSMPRVGTEDVSLADYKRAVEMPSVQQMTEEDIVWRNEILDKAKQNNLALISAYKEWLMWEGGESSIEGPSAEDPAIMVPVSMDIAPERREFIKNNLSLSKFTGTATIPKDYNIYGKHFGNVLKEIIQDSSEYRASGETYGNIFMSENLAAQGDVSIGVYATTLKITGSIQTAEMYFNTYYNNLTKQNGYAPVYNPFKFKFTLRYTDYFTGQDKAITRTKFVDNDRFAITKEIVNNPEILKSIFNVISQNALVTENIDALINILTAEIKDADIESYEELFERAKSLFDIDLPPFTKESEDIDTLMEYLHNYFLDNPDSVSKAFISVIGKPIGTDTQSQFLSAALLNTKELILSRIGATSLTNSAITTMLVLGYNVGTIIDFIHSKDVDAVFKVFEKQIGDLKPVSVSSYSISKIKGINKTSPGVKSLMALLDISSEIQKFRGVRSLNENSTVDTSQIRSKLAKLDVDLLRQAILSDNISILGTPSTDATKVFSPEHMIFLQPQARYLFENIINREQAIERLFKSTKAVSTIMGDIKKTPEAFKNADRYIHDLQISTFYSKPIGKNEAGLSTYRTGIITTVSGRYKEKVPLNTHANRAIFIRQFGHYLAYAARALTGEDPAIIHALSTILPSVMSRVDAPVYYMPKLKTRDNNVDSSIAIMALRQLHASTGNRRIDDIKKDLYDNLSNYALLVSSGSVKKGSMIEAFEEINLELAKHIQTLTMDKYMEMLPENEAVKKLVVGEIHSEVRTIEINRASEKRKPSYNNYDDLSYYDEVDMDTSYDQVQKDVYFEEDYENKVRYQSKESAMKLGRVVEPENILIGSIFSLPSKLLKKDLFYAHTQGEVAYRLFKVDAAEAVPGSMEPSSMVIPRIRPDFINDLEKTPYRLGYPAKYNNMDARVLAYMGEDSINVDGVPLSFESYLIVTDRSTFTVSGEVLMDQNPGHLFYKNAMQKTSINNKLIANRELNRIKALGPDNIAKLASIKIEKGTVTTFI